MFILKLKWGYPETLASDTILFVLVSNYFLLRNNFMITLKIAP